MTYLADRASDRADTTVTLEREVLHRLILGETSIVDAVHQGTIGVEGDAAMVAELFGLLDDFSATFEIVEPKPDV